MCKMIKSSFACPVCGKTLTYNEKSYYCKNNHCFDISKKGYVNLLLSNRMNAKNPGDNKLMVRSRTDFLNKGFYEPLLKALGGAVCRYAKNGDVIIDAGCGEGYYTAGVKKILKENGIEAVIAGIDISKNALGTAAKRDGEIEYAAGSVFHLPLKDSSCDMLMTVFAPYCGEEFRRVLKNGGVMVMVIPDKNHLWQLKEAVYDKPYLNEVKDTELEGFDFVEKLCVREKIQLECQKDIQDLFNMTPYCYNTSSEGRERLAALDSLETEIEFDILIYRR